MGLFGRKRTERLTGTARVVSVSSPPYDATHGSLTMDVVVEVPGVPAYAHHYRKMIVSVSKWPHPGVVLPVTVDPDDHDDVEVPWDDLQTNRKISKQQAEQLASVLNAYQHHPTGSGVPQNPADLANAPEIVNIVQSLQQMFPGASVGAGGDLSGQGLPPPVVGAGGQFNVVAGQSNADPVDRLEKLAKLRETGIIDDHQFAQLRAQILGQAGLDDQ